MDVTNRIQVKKKWFLSKTILAGIWAVGVTLFQIWAVWVDVPPDPDAPPGTVIEQRLTIAAPSEARIGATFAAVTGLGGVIWGRKTAKQPI
jgi:hypothetical protein